MKNRVCKIFITLALIAVICATAIFCVGCKADPPTATDDEYVDKENNEENGNMNSIATFIIKAQDGEILTVRIELYPDKAPITVENFTKLANDGYYDGLCFHRVVPNGCLQGGGYKIEQNTIMEAPELEAIKGEFASNGWTQNDLKHELGVISMARTNVKDSATSQFFICIGSYPSWDGEYAAFGKATEQESLDNLVKLGQSTYGNIGGGFTTFPYPIIEIVSVRVQ